MALLVLDGPEYRAFRLEESKARRRSALELEKVYARFDRLSAESQRDLHQRSLMLAQRNRESFQVKVRKILVAVRKHQEGGKGLTRTQAGALLRVVFEEHLGKAYNYGRYSRIGAAAFSPANRTDSGERYVRDTRLRQMGFMRRYMAQYASERYKGLGLKARISMYAASLGTAYDEGRLSVVADAGNMVIEWAQAEGDGNDGLSCASCRYLRPRLFLKSTLPCVPCDGTTLCLSNCRDTLVVRRAESEDELERAGSLSKEDHLRTLDSIRAQERPNSYN